MKKLYMIRHAKSSWKEIDLADFDRPLNKRGKASAKFMGQILKERLVVPDMILTSPANRAKSTARAIEKELGCKGVIKYDDKIYEAYVDDLLNVLLKVDDRVDTLFLIGHNPGFNALADYLTEFHENIVTCGIVEIDFNVKSWGEINPSNARFKSFDYPRNHPEFIH